MKRPAHISAERARKAKAYRALPIAKVIRPLRHIVAKHTVRGTDGKGNVTTELDFFTQAAVTYARRGWGRIVQTMAMQDI